MDSKYFILTLFCGFLNNNAFSSETKANTTNKWVQPTTSSSSISNILANSESTTENHSTLPTEFNNFSAEQTLLPSKVTGEEPTPAALISSAKPTAQSSARPPLTYNTINQATPSTANTTSAQTAVSEFTSVRKPPTQSVHASPRQALLSAHTSSSKPLPPTTHDLSTQLTPSVQNPPRITPGFTFHATTNKETLHKTNSSSTAAILIGIILTFMLIAIIIIVLWKCMKKPVLNDQNWAGRSPFADGETPDLCMDNIRQNEVTSKRTSIASLITWKPGKSTLLADNLEIKLFESNENLENSSNSKIDTTKEHVNDASEDSADRSTIGTAVSLSDDADLPPPPPCLDLEGQEMNQSVTPIMTTAPPLPDDSDVFPSPVDCLNQTCEDHKPSPLPDSLNLPLPPDFMQSQDFNNDNQCQEYSILLDSNQHLNESLPLPPEELF
ncbi:protein EVI2B [Ochotona princeps]|uniref:protein EVI2B n=1 Tax=Ochotona princeps TaxID=9978 RepID=UPI0027151E5B|nr:protein EVI2B [Ochotona princeps]XP_058531537.1 protein EVI2B [Ochotona princeps]